MSLNQAQVIGYLGNDPETRYTQGGEAVTSISVATSERWKDKHGEQQERTEWHRVTFFGKLAEIAGEYLKKGSLVFVQGRLQTDKYEKDGVDHYSTKIIARDLKMLGPKRDDAGGGQREERPQRPAKPAGAGSAPAPRQNDFDADFADDDIPF